MPLQDPPLKGYLIHAYPLSIVTTTEKSKPWLYSNYVQIWCDKNLFESAKVLKIDFLKARLVLSRIIQYHGWKYAR